MEFRASPPTNGPESQPDIMNDPTFATNCGKKGRPLDDPDTCRICRGEGSEDEELFYPCKCSGSIKFVHQSCLMEWLSHSQKKYCELCKTPFRFTKLYDPNMPDELPAPLFLKELMMHAARSVVTWLRFLLVAFVWLGWLPWSMRAVWRGLFWLADGRWPASETVQATTSFAASESLSSLAAQGTSPVTHIFASTSPASVAHNISSVIPQFILPVSPILNFTAGEPLIYSIAKRLLANAVVLTTTVATPTSDPGNLTASATRRLRQPSWLSDVEFLKTLTPYPTINNILIDTLEGQLITLLVVILFIHVFLIREWVIQQQPAINLAEGEREAAVQLLRGNRANPVADVEPVDRHEDEPLERDMPLIEAAQPETDDGAADDITTTVDAPFEFEEPSLVARNTPPEVFTPGSSVSHATMPELDPSRDTTDNQASVVGTGLDLNHYSNQMWSFGTDGMNSLPSGEPSSASTRNGDQNPDSQGFMASSPLPKAPGEMYSFADSGIFGPYIGNESRHSSEGAPVIDHARIDPTESARADENSSLNANSSVQSSASQGPVPPHVTSPIFGNRGHELPGNQFEFRSAVELPLMQPDFNAGIHADPRLPEPSEEQTEGIFGGNSLMPMQPLSDRSSQATEARRPDELAQFAHDPRSLRERIVEWFWGDIPTQRRQEDQGADDARRVENPAREQPFVPVRHGQHMLDANAGAGNEPPNRVAAPANEAVDNDDAVDDGDDLEGVMELIGMHGAIFGLLQNGVFSALLISFTVTVGIWLPYLWGKIALVLLTNPIRLFIGIPLAIFSIVADVVVDTAIGSFAYLVYVGNVLMRAAFGQIGKLIPVVTRLSASNAVTHASLSLIDGSGTRLKRIATTFFTFRDSDVPMFSVLAHQALRIHQARITAINQFFFRIVKTVVYDLPLCIVGHDSNQSLLERLSFLDPTKVLVSVVSTFRDLTQAVYSLLKYGDLSHLNAAADYTTSATLDSDLAYWDTKDRIIAIVVGYGFASLAGLFYLRLSTYFSGEQRGQRVNGAVAEVLHQAGGVMKVILIIGIEMLIFPLYCGILLDIALMPLFENATFGSRLSFAMVSPLTSLFVHWFIGTCYMFHFALFVSMCRKIMRSGVLYFIRDPDDPTFHPVRDVLERNVSTQLRKIAFSALVYGALVVICMGGVVWGLSFTLRGVLPLHWSSNEPVLEFPVDLLFYNLVMPFAIRSIKPSDILHNMYDWWFHRCARFLRLTDFLFGLRKRDEEGQRINRTWAQTLLACTTSVPDDVASDDKFIEELKNDPNFVRDGRFVRTPASDQVRIPKGTKVFLEVDEYNERLDGKPDHDDGLHGKANDMFTKVYVPPKFKSRIAAFIFLIWVFAATTGVGATILPLVIGRKVVSFMFPPGVQTNDLYAFSAGFYSLGGIGYALYHSQRWAASLRGKLQHLSSPKQFLPKIFKTFSYIAGLVYVFGAFAFVIPSVFAIVTELYFLVPIHTYFGPEGTHVIHFVQDWTLGVLYTRMAVRLMLRNETSRPAVALKAIVRNGWLQPDIKFATRAFILPTLLATTIAVLTPLPLGFMLNATAFKGEPALVHSQVYRYSYPAFLVLVLLCWGLHLLRRQINIWRMGIRDDVYLIGERLHNFGEKRARDMGATRRMI